MKRAAAAVLAVLLLAGCGGPSPKYDAEKVEGDITPVEVVLPSGETVTCLVYTAYRKAGLDCNWKG